MHRNVQRFRGGLVFNADRLCVSLNSRLESNKEEEEEVFHESRQQHGKCLSTRPREGYGLQGPLALKDYRSFPRALADMLSARKVISLITRVIRSRLI